MRNVLPVVLLILLIAAALPAPAAQEKTIAPLPPPPPPKSADAKLPEAKLPAAKALEAKAAEAKPGQIKPIADEENSCIQCHATLTEPDQKRFLVTAKDLANDIHWQQGLRCQDCHGGDPTVFEIKAHQAKDDFKTVKSPADIPQFCGDCHANIEYMRRYRPSPRTDQLAEYRTSGHGQKLKTGDVKVATCVSCHDKPHGTVLDASKHGIRPVAEPQSPVYRTRVATTCATCHSDQKLMAGRTYHGKPLPCDEYAKWRGSVHGKAMLDRGDLSAPTCNNCHGNHGAVPPQVDSVANACGVCHGKIAKLFTDTRMKHKFEAVGLPGCATCHSNHGITQPSDDMLGMQGTAVCATCHEKGKFGATIAGAQAARTLRSDLDQLKEGITSAKETLDQAEQLGMEISEPRFQLRKASDSLTNARSLIHTFQVKPVEAALADGGKVVLDVQEKADRALQEHTSRRIWLAAFLVPILLVIGVLLLFIRTLPVPKS